VSPFFGKGTGMRTKSKAWIRDDRENNEWNKEWWIRSLNVKREEREGRAKRK
jgi:hypothetical protein